MQLGALRLSCKALCRAGDDHMMRSLSLSRSSMNVHLLDCRLITKQLKTKASCRLHVNICAVSICRDMLASNKPSGTSLVHDLEIFELDRSQRQLPLFQWQLPLLVGNIGQYGFILRRCNRRSIQYVAEIKTHKICRIDQGRLPKPGTGESWNPVVTYTVTLQFFRVLQHMLLPLYQKALCSILLPSMICIAWSMVLRASSDGYWYGFGEPAVGKY